MDFPMATLGFDTSALVQFMATPRQDRNPDELPPQPDPVSVRGDVWIMGEHRLVCGDCTDPEAVGKCFDGDQPNLLVSDPPYGVNYDPNWRTKLDKVERATGKVQNDDKADWQAAFDLFPGNVAYVWHGGIESAAAGAALAASGFVIRAQIIWAKPHFAIGQGNYHHQHEPCFYAVKKGGTAAWQGGRKQSTVWNIDNGTFQGGKRKAEDEKTGHGTQKPVECMKRPIENNSVAGDLVYDPFSGSFTTGIACELTNRRCRAIEIAPEYVDLSIIRWQTFTGNEAIHAESGKTFAQIAAERTPGGGH